MLKNNIKFRKSLCDIFLSSELLQGNKAHYYWAIDSEPQNPKTSGPCALLYPRQLLNGPNKTAGTSTWFARETRQRAQNQKHRTAFRTPVTGPPASSDELLDVRPGRRRAGPRLPDRLRPRHGRRALLRPLEAPPGPYVDLSPDRLPPPLQSPPPAPLPNPNPEPPAFPWRRTR